MDLDNERQQLAEEQVVTRKSADSWCAGDASLRRVPRWYPVFETRAVSLKALLSFRFVLAG